MPDTIVGIVAHNNEEEIDACLRSMHAYTSSHSLEYVLVDNASVDRTRACFESFLAAHPGVLVASRQNEGCNQGWNHAFNIARRYQPDPKYLILLNSDCQALRPLWDRELIAALEASGQATCEAMGVLHYPGGNLQHLGSAGIVYRMDALMEIWTEDDRRKHQIGPWDAETFPGWEGDCDLFSALCLRGYLPALARDGVHMLHLCGRTECKLRQGEEFLAYQRAAKKKLFEVWNGTTEYERWWGHRRTEMCIESVVEYVDCAGWPHFWNGVDEKKAREAYPWL